MLHKLEVGKLYEQGKTRYQEGVRFDFTQAGAALLLFLNRPTQEEIESIKAGKLEVGFRVMDEAIFFLCHFENMNWMDAPYSIHLSQPFEFMELEDSQGYSLNIILVDSSTGIIKAMRYVGLSNNFSKKLRAAIEVQKDKPFNKIVYNRKITSVYGSYTTNDLVKIADERYTIK